MVQRSGPGRGLAAECHNQHGCIQLLQGEGCTVARNSSALSGSAAAELESQALWLSMHVTVSCMLQSIEECMHPASDHVVQKVQRSGMCMWPYNIVCRFCRCRCSVCFPTGVARLPRNQGHLTLPHTHATPRRHPVPPLLSLRRCAGGGLCWRHQQRADTRCRRAKL